MELSDRSDDELLAELRSAQQAVVEAGGEIAERRRSWQRVMDATKELERRYPIAAEPLK
jgi:hypothetical protein